MSELDFQKIFASGASSQIDWTDDNYLKGWGYLGNVPPSYQSFDSLQRLNDLKFKYLYDEFMEIETNTEELISNHNENSEAHKTLFDKKLDKNGGTVTGNLNASGYNITATKFIGNLQGNADSATKANQDSQGQTINTTYVKGVTASNSTITVTKGNGTTSTATINNVAHSTSADSATEAGNINKGFQVNEEDFHISDFRQTILGRANNGICARPFCGKLPNNTAVSSPGIAFGGIDTHGFIQMEYGTPNIYVGAGNANKINWYKKLAITDSPAFSGTPTAPTPGTTDNSTRISNTSWVQTWVKNFINSLDDNLDVQWSGSTFTVPALGITGLMAQNGYISLGKLFGGLILQWGTFIANNINDILYFPLAFSRTILSLNISHSTNRQEDFKQYSVYNTKSNSFQINSSEYELGVYYFAVGL